MTVAGCCLERREQIEPAHLRHPHVGEDDVGPKRGDQRERGLSAVGDLDFVTVLPQEGAKDETDVFFVVAYQHTSHGYLAYLATFAALT